jgi:hypothetical protein
VVVPVGGWRLLDAGPAFTFLRRRFVTGEGRGMSGDEEMNREEGRVDRTGQRRQNTTICHTMTVRGER